MIMTDEQNTPESAEETSEESTGSEESTDAEESEEESEGEEA